MQFAVHVGGGFLLAGVAQGVPFTDRHAIAIAAGFEHFAVGVFSAPGTMLFVLPVVLIGPAFPFRAAALADLAVQSALLEVRHRDQTVLVVVAAPGAGAQAVDHAAFFAAAAVLADDSVPLGDTVHVMFQAYHLAVPETGGPFALFPGIAQNHAFGRAAAVVIGDHPQPYRRIVAVAALGVALEAGFAPAVAPFAVLAPGHEHAGGGVAGVADALAVAVVAIVEVVVIAVFIATFLVDLAAFRASAFAVIIDPHAVAGAVPIGQLKQQVAVFVVALFGAVQFAGGVGFDLLNPAVLEV